MLLQALHSWQPFKIDALGIVTLLGASEMDRNLGRLSRYSYLEPLLGAYLIANNDITKPITGFTLYNVDDGIMARDIAGWFGRWLNSQNFSWNSSYLHFFPPQPPQKNHVRIRSTISGVLVIVSMGVMVMISVFTEDWWGLANAISMLLSIVSRAVVMTENRRGLDIAYEKVSKKTWAGVYKTSLLITPDGRAITIYAPCGIITDILLTNPTPPHIRFYNLARWVGWFGFALHVVSLGMALLINQLLTVALLVTCTILVARGVGADMLSIGSEIQVDRFDEVGERDTRSRAYLRMDLNQDQQAAMLTWGLFPQRSNAEWWDRYQRGSAETGREAFDKWKGTFCKPLPCHGVSNSPKSPVTVTHSSTV